MHEQITLKAKAGEQLIWNRLLQNPHDKSCTLSYRFLISLSLSHEQINAAIHRFLSQHEALNYRFYESEGVLYKRYYAPSLNPIHELEEQECIEKVFFAYAHEPLYVFQTQALTNGFYLYVHLSHLIIDGSSFNLLVSALEAAFLNQPSTNYAKVQSIADETTEVPAYWTDYINGRSLSQTVPFLEYSKSDDLVNHAFFIEPEITAKLLNYKMNKGITLFHLMTGALAITLHHYLKDEAEETHLSLAYYVNLNKNTFGCDINLLPLFISCHEEQTLFQVVQQISDIRKEQRLVQNTPVLEIMQKSNTVTPIQNQKLLNVVVNESPGLFAHATSDLLKQVIGIDNQSAANTLSLLYTITGDQLTVRFESRHGRLFQALLKQFAHHFKEILTHLVTEPETKLNAILFRENEFSVSCGATFSAEKESLWNAFLQQINRQQEQIAVTDEFKSLSYSDVSLAITAVYKTFTRLETTQLKQGVALFLTRSSMLPVAMLGAIAAQVTFIPLAENTPAAARMAIINETQTHVILVDNHSEQLLTEEEKQRLQIINLELIESVSKEYAATLHMKSLIENDTAYILFTSGSTGKPKGVMIGYDNLHHFLSAVSHNPGFTEKDELLALTAISFDISINELLLPLFCGGRVVIAPQNTRANYESLGRMIHEGKTSVVQATPSTLNLLMQSQWLWHNKRQLRFWVGGEALTADLVSYFKEQHIEIFNMYGPTETTIWASATRIDSPQLLSIGVPLANTSLYVLDQEGRSLPLGMAGELVIEGKLVGKGYVNYPSTSFIQSDNGLMCYKTGDKVIALAKNTIIYLKRYDEQVKLRGYRIELEEINNHLRTLIPQFVGITLMVTQPEPHLCVYYSSPVDLDVDAVMDRLKIILPEYKVPQRYILLKTMPLNNSGKVDKKRLAQYSKADLEGIEVPLVVKKQVKTCTVAEQMIIDLIMQEFKIKINDIHSSLLDYGFNSLSFNQLALLFDKKLGSPISAHQFYHLNNVKKLAEYSLLNKPNPASTFSMPECDQKQENMAIAIIGYDALLPQGKDPQQFWHSLVNQEYLVSPNQRAWMSSASHAGYIKNVEYFDRKFFNLSPIEVMHMDFRQRLLLQCAFRTLEHASIPAATLEQKQVACFIATTGIDSLLAFSKHNVASHPYSLSGNSLSMLANRLSYYFNWHGPSVTVDTACSGSLAALARATESLALGRASMCFVGSANLIVDSEVTEALHAGRFLSPQNRCASFLDEADGYVRGEGILGFLLKPLEQAKKDGDVIHAVIHHVVENHGGRSASLTSPSQQAQSELLKQAYPLTLAEKLSFIETHGTGTRLGDPIEIDALKEFESHSLSNNKQENIYLGALKQNIGHLEASAGFASILKIILAMKHQFLPANAQSNSINPLIHFKDSKFKLLEDGYYWPKPVTAGVSSFGFGGSNGHAVLSSYEPAVLSHISDEDETELPIILSAKTMSSLRARISNLLDDLNEEHALGDIAYTLAVGRTHFSCRTALLASSKQDLEMQLHELLKSDSLVIPLKTCALTPVVQDYLAGNTIDWQSTFQLFNATRVALSPYTFDMEVCLHDAFIKKSDLMDDIRWTQLTENQYKIIVKATHPFLAQHQVFQHKVLPGVAYIDLLLRKLSGIHQKTLCLERIFWLHPAVCEGEELVLILETNTMGHSTHFKFSTPGQILATGEYSFSDLNEEQSAFWLENAKNKLHQAGLEQLSSDVLYKKFNVLGIDYGHYFQGINSVQINDNLAFTQISINPNGSSVGLLDAAFQSGMAINLSEAKAGLMPFSLGKFIVLDADKLRLLEKACVYTLKNSAFRTNFIICDENKKPVVILVDLGVKPSLLPSLSLE